MSLRRVAFPADCRLVILLESVSLDNAFNEPNYSHEGRGLRPLLVVRGCLYFTVEAGPGLPQISFKRSTVEVPIFMMMESFALG